MMNLLSLSDQLVMCCWVNRCLHTGHSPLITAAITHRGGGAGAGDHIVESKDRLYKTDAEDIDITIFGIVYIITIESLTNIGNMNLIHFNSPGFCRRCRTIFICKCKSTSQCYLNVLYCNPAK